jgi:transposase
LSKTFRPYEPDQVFLMPASMKEWLPSDHLAYFISDVVDHLDLSAIMERYAGEERGYPPYHPGMMVKVLLYAYCTGVASSRKIERHLCEDIAFRVLAANNTPDFRTISDFRKDHLKALAGLFLQVLKLCQKAGLVKLGHVALDGTKIRANASRHKAMSYKRMKEEEARLEAEVMELLKKAATVDEEEDQRYGRGKRGDELPKELAFRESRLKKIREAKAALEAEVRLECEKRPGKGEKDATPPDNTQRNFTDPDSRIMPAPGGKHFIQAYNAQAAVDSAHQVIVAAEVTNKPSDRGQTEPMDDGSGAGQYRSVTAPDVSRCRVLLQ